MQGGRRTGNVLMDLVGLIFYRSEDQEERAEPADVWRVLFKGLGWVRSAGWLAGMAKIGGAEKRGDAGRGGGGGGVHRRGGISCGKVW